MIYSQAREFGGRLPAYAVDSRHRGRAMRDQIVLLDFANYQFLRSTAATLRTKGVNITFVYNNSIQTPNQNAAPALGEVGIGVRGSFDKYSPLRRLKHEAEWARKCVSILETMRPSVLLSSNTPLEVQRRLLSWCHRNRVPFVFWMQDILGRAIHSALGRRWGHAGAIIGRYYEALEAKLLRMSEHVILISEDHQSLVEQYGLDPSRVSVIPNWAVIEDFPNFLKDNAWSRQFSVSQTFNFIYSGTLGMKHNPGMLLKLAQQFSAHDNVRIIVVSEGIGADWLRHEGSQLGLTSLMLLPFQPLEVLPLMLSSADVLLSVLNSDASEFSVPSKVLTYLCVGRPVLMAVPAGNRASRLISDVGAGIVVPPDCEKGFCDSAMRLFNNESERRSMAQRGRNYAELEFRSEQNCQKLMSVVDAVMERCNTPNRYGEEQLTARNVEL